MKTCPAPRRLHPHVGRTGLPKPAILRELYTCPILGVHGPTRATPYRAANSGTQQFQSDTSPRRIRSPSQSESRSCSAVASGASPRSSRSARSRYSALTLQAGPHPQLTVPTDAVRFTHSASDAEAREPLRYRREYGTRQHTPPRVHCMPSFGVTSGKSGAGDTSVRETRARSERTIIIRRF